MCEVRWYRVAGGGCIAKRRTLLRAMAEIPEEEGLSLKGRRSSSTSVKPRKLLHQVAPVPLICQHASQRACEPVDIRAPTLRGSERSADNTTSQLRNDYSSWGVRLRSRCAMNSHLAVPRMRVHCGLRGVATSRCLDLTTPLRRSACATGCSSFTAAAPGHLAHHGCRSCRR